VATTAAIGANPVSRKNALSADSPARSTPPIASGVAIGRRPVDQAVSPVPVRSCTPSGCKANADSWNARRSADAMPSCESGRSNCMRAAEARDVLGAAKSVISSMGVIPAIGSFENDPSEYDTAPMRRPLI
jgi:hypothetical protein